MDTNILVIVIVVAIVLIILVGAINAFSSKQYPEDVRARRQRILSSLGVTDAESYFTEDGPAVIQARDGRTWLLSSSDAVPEPLTSRNLLAAEVLIDGITSTRARRGAQIKASLIGNLLAGDKGAIIGALGAQQISTTGFSKVALLLTTSNPENPLVEITMWDTPGISADLEHSNQLRALAQEWCARMEVVMRAVPEANSSIEDKSRELARWAALLEAGHITREEFERQKQLILAR